VRGALGARRGGGATGGRPLRPAALAPRERDVIALKFAAGLGNAEIAKVLGLSQSNTGTRLHRAIEKLREACREEL
jgi:DNA-directed RNA polymerase specialized sigma24 family protein